MVQPMRLLFALPALMSLPASAQDPAVAPLSPVVPEIAAQVPPAAPDWQPAAPYITAGQDEAGYRAWYGMAPWRATYVQAFHNYLQQYGVAGTVPTWQLLRTATSWQRCGSQPFEVPPTTAWPNIVQTLRYVRDHVVPAIGPVEAVSAYRNPVLNACAGGAMESAHKHYSAIDLVPLTPTSRGQLMRRLCAVHARDGGPYQVGLGFYAFLRFHVDSTKYRRWGADSGDVAASCPPFIRPTVIAAAGKVQAQATEPAGQQQPTSPSLDSAAPAGESADPQGPAPPEPDGR